MGSPVEHQCVLLVAPDSLHVTHRQGGVAVWEAALLFDIRED